jgi:hypothetical protein
MLLIRIYAALMDVRTDRLVALAGGIDTVEREVAPTVLDEVRDATAGALGRSLIAEATGALADVLGDHLHRWRRDLTAWADTARACAAGYDEADQRTRTRFEQVAV